MKKTLLLASLCNYFTFWSWSAQLVKNKRLFGSLKGPDEGSLTRPEQLLWAVTRWGFFRCWISCVWIEADGVGMGGLWGLYRPEFRTFRGELVHTRLSSMFMVSRSVFAQMGPSHSTLPAPSSSLCMTCHYCNYRAGRTHTHIYTHTRAHRRPHGHTHRRKCIHVAQSLLVRKGGVLKSGVGSGILCLCHSVSLLHAHTHTFMLIHAESRHGNLHLLQISTLFVCVCVCPGTLFSNLLSFPASFSLPFYLCPLKGI